MNAAFDGSQAELEEYLIPSLQRFVHIHHLLPSIVDLLLHLLLFQPQTPEKSLLHVLLVADMWDETWS